MVPDVRKNEGSCDRRTKVPQTGNDVAIGMYNLLIRKRDAVLASRPGLFILIAIAAVVIANTYTLRTDGIFSCPADGYTSDRYLSYCNGPQFGDYEHGALWFDLEPSIKKSVSSADVIFLGDSHGQYGFSTDATIQWFDSAYSKHYLLGFIYGENVVFEEKILHKLNPIAKVYVIPVNFFERSETSIAKDVMHAPASFYRYKAKQLLQFAHRQICQRISAICGHTYAIFRSRETGAYYRSGWVPAENPPVSYEHDIDPEKIKYYIDSAESFLARLPVRRECMILTTVPTVRANAFVYSPSVETAEAVAKGLGVSFVPAPLDGLRTFDGAHLNRPSAERWSTEFLREAGPQILRCIREPAKSGSYDRGK
jgi:hypothetical protein